MECNKEEAVRAKDIAERKMQSSDFVGARKIALKAQQLFPDLENISQLLTVCEVHCSAQNKLYGSEMDWYGILQLEKIADEATIKKQYRKLALFLHPDKNKFAGAEAAFKMIGEANRVLSDRNKRSLYDMKCRVPVRTAVAPKHPPHQVHKNSFVKKQFGGQNNFPNVPNPQFTGLNPHQQSQSQSQSGLHNGTETFWTCCPFCNMRYQYYRNVISRTLRCQNCAKPYVAHDMGIQGMPSGSKLKHPLSTHQKGVPSPAAFQMGSRSTSGNPLFTTGVQGSFTSKTVGAEPATKAGSFTEVVGGSKTKGKEDQDVDVGDGKKGVRRSKYDAAKVREPAARNTSRKRGRKFQVESSESLESSSSDDTEVVIEENGFSYAGQSTGSNGGDRRRSSRQKQHVSYKERLSDDDDFVSPSKRSRGSGSSGATEDEIKAAPPGAGASDNSADSGSVGDEGRKEVKQKARAPHEESLANRKGKVEDGEDNGADSATANHNDEKSKIEDNSESASEVYEYPDPDFSDFDKDKAEHCFDVDQVWAVYDTIDGMPRFYARVKKVFSPGFKLRITWLEADPNDPTEIQWAEEGLPVACGKFKHGTSQEIVDRLMFSHMVHVERGRGRGSYVIYPRKGETWALFKDWDIGWSSDPENHKVCKFELVEIISDFDQVDGIGVVYLSKVRGFVSLFQKTPCNGVFSFQIPANELFKFSHQIPSFRMTGREREGVPEGSFELDPVSLPSDLDEFYNPTDVKMKNESMDAEVNGSCSKSPENSVNLKIDSEMTETPRKHDKTLLERENLGPRRSPRESNSVNKKHSQVNSGRWQEEADKSLDVSKEEYNGNHSKFEGSMSHLADEKVSTPKKHDKEDIEREASKLRRSPREFMSRNQSHVNSSQVLTQDVANKHSGGSRDKSHDTLGPSEGASSHVDEEMQGNGRDKCSSSFAKSCTVPPISTGHRFAEAKSYDFNENKSEDKFMAGQVWALYNDRDRLPIKYAQVIGKESNPFVLHLQLLEPLSPPKDVIYPICCGTFRRQNSIIQVVKREAFSHLVNADCSGKRFKIHPKKGEVWAMYKNWNIESKCSDPNREYEIVEVLEETDLCTTVSILVRVNGSKLIYKAPRKQRSSIGIVDVPPVELSRFSHQIPAFWHTGEKDSHLRDCWQLDPSSVPGTTIYLD